MMRVRVTCHCLLTDIPAPDNRPKTRNSDVRPCHTPIRKNVTKNVNTLSVDSIPRDWKRLISASSIGLYTYVLSHPESVMCQRFQNSRTEPAENGRSKFSGS